MEVVSAIIFLDEWLFLTINNLKHSYFLDWIFLFFSFYPLIIWLLIGLMVILIEERKDKIFLLHLIVALVLSGIAASVLIKPLVKRPRPDIKHGLDVVIVNEKPAAIPFNNDFAFPSGHAAVAFAGAYVLTREETSREHRKHGKKYKKIASWIFYLLAFLTAFSRIYLGKHYPLDVIAGALLGMGIGLISWRIIELFIPKEVY